MRAAIMALWAIALAVGSAFAQTAPTGSDVLPTGPQLSAAAAAAPETPPCYAKPLGTAEHGGTGLLEGVGRVDWWWCSGQQWPVLLTKRDGYALVFPEIAGLSPREAADRIWRANVALPCSDARIAALCAFGDVLADQQRPASVAKNGAYQDRPMWNADGSASALRATVGAPCACAKYVIKGTQMLCRLKSPAAGPELTACTRAAL